MDFLTDTFVRIREKLLGRASRVLHDSILAEDSLQEAFIRLWGRYRIESEKEAEALLNRTVHNVSVDALRRKRSIPIRGDLPEDGSPDRAAEKERLFLWLEKQMESTLSDTQQYIIQRHEYEGASLELIAKELGMQAAAVRMQLSRARKNLKSKYNEQD